MATMDSSVLLRTAYVDVRVFLINWKGRLGQTIVDTAVHLDRILEIQGTGRVSQVSLGAMSQRLTEIQHALVEDVQIEDDQFLSEERGRILKLVSDMILEVDNVRQALNLEAIEHGSEAYLGDAEITNRILGYLGQPWNSRELHEVGSEMDNEGTAYLKYLTSNQPTEYL